MIPCQVKVLSPSSLESSSWMWQGKRDEKVNQPSRWGCPSATGVLIEALVSSRFHKGTVTHAAKILPSIPSILKHAVDMIHVFENTCLIWQN